MAELAKMTINLNTLRPRQNGCHFADDIFNCIFLNENVWIPIEISLKFVPKGPIKNIPALVQIMGWRRPGDKPLSEPMMVSLPTHICVTRPQWVNTNMNGYYSLKLGWGCLFLNRIEIFTEIKIGAMHSMFILFCLVNHIVKFNDCFLK